jgi:hypothetical protein
MVEALDKAARKIELRLAYVASPAGSGEREFVRSRGIKLTALLWSGKKESWAARISVDAEQWDADGRSTEAETARPTAAKSWGGGGSRGGGGFFARLAALPNLNDEMIGEVIDGEP